VNLFAACATHPKGSKLGMHVVVGNGFVVRSSLNCLRAGFVAFLIASPSLARAQSIISSEMTVVTLTAVPQPDDRLLLTAAVTTGQGGGVPGGTLQFIDETNGGLLGWAEVATPSIIVARLMPGEHRIRVRYSGTMDFMPQLFQSARSVVLVHRELSKPAVTVSASGNPGTPGEVVTLTAVVSGRDMAPKGSVTFRDGAQILAHVGLDRGGTASFTTSALAEGARAVTAEYEGDGAYASAVSPRLTQDVAAISNRSAPREP
jgi:hypothetical protein